MTSITIRHVPEEVRNSLAARAAATGRSLQEYLLVQLEVLVSKPDPDAWLAMVERDRPVDSEITNDEIVNIIRDDRNSRS